MGNDIKKTGFLGRLFGKNESETPENELTEKERERREFLIKSSRAMFAIALGGTMIMSTTEATAGHHHERRDTPEHRVPNEFTERMQSEELMRPAEVQKMQNCQEIVFRHYLNPSFHLHLKRILDQTTDRTTNMPTNIVLQALETIMKYPHDLSYREVQREYGDVIEITKRPTAPGSSATYSSDVPADFKVTIEDGFITKVGDTDLIKKGEIIPWESAEVNASNMPSRDKKILNAILNYPVDIPEGLTGDELLRYIKEKKIANLPAYLKDTYTIVTLELAKRIVSCIVNRNHAGQLDPDRSGHAGYQEMLTLLQDQPERYDQLVDHSPTIDVGANPNYPGLYFVFRTSDFRQLLVVNHEGYIMKQKLDVNDNPTGEYEPDDAYMHIPGMGANRITQRYYESHEAAKDLDDL